MAAAVSACGGGSGSGPRPTGPFTAQHEALFDDAVDFIETPNALEGRWLRDWEQDTSARVSEANVIALVDVLAVHSDTDVERRSRIRVAARTVQVLLGEPPGSELALWVAEGEPGYPTVDGNASRLLQKRFVAFLRWQQVDGGRVRPRWHLSPASSQVLARLRMLIDLRSGAATARAGTSSGSGGSRAR